MLTDAQRKLQTGGTKSEFPWLVVGIIFYGIQAIGFIASVIACNLGY